MIGRSLWLAAALCIGQAHASAADFVELDGAQIRAALSGKLVTDEYHWRHRYFADGRLERSENQRQKTGRWSVQNNRLCLLQPKTDAKLCYRVFRRGDELEYRDDRYVVYSGRVRPCPTESLIG